MKMATISTNPVGRLHVLTDTVLQGSRSHAELARLALVGGADAIQFRQKQGTTRSMIADALAMKRVCAEAHAPLIVNDRLDVALAVQADGVHLGQDDFPLAQARAILGPGKIIGGSAGTMEEALLCLREGADYVGFGPVFPTGSKADAGPASGLELLRRVAQALSPLPVIAIGGIGPDNAAQVRSAGAHGLAVISAVCCQLDPTAATQALLRAWDHASPWTG